MSPLAAVNAKDPIEVLVKRFTVFRANET